MSSRDDFASLEPNLEDLEDLDRYEPLDDLERRTAKRPRGAHLVLVLAAVLIAAVAGGGLWYVLERFSGDQDIPLVEADRTPVKVRPDEPGGMAVPHRDKELARHPDDDAAHAHDGRDATGKIACPEQDDA